jgi:thiamine biosynthesis protein ThiS
LNLTGNPVREAVSNHKHRPPLRLFLLEKRMQITINGELRDITTRTMMQLLESLDIDPRKVAVERNAEILPKAEYATTTLADNDRIEIMHFVGGG